MGRFLQNSNLCVKSGIKPNYSSLIFEELFQKLQITTFSGFIIWYKMKCVISCCFAKHFELALSICLFVHPSYKFIKSTRVNFLINQLYSSLAQLFATFKTFCLVYLVGRSLLHCIKKIICMMYLWRIHLWYNWLCRQHATHEKRFWYHHHITLQY